MFRVYAAKQVGQLSYMVPTLEVLRSILQDQSIWTGESEERNPASGKKEHYVSFSRNMTAAAKRNNKRWRYGVIINGDRLSEHYKIEPFSFAGAAFEENATFRIKTLTSYDDGTCKLNLVNWPAIQISRDTFEEIKQAILNQPEEFNQSHKLQYQQGGKRKVEGRFIDEKFNYNVKHGDSGAILKKDNVSSDLIYRLTKGDSTNEYEERIWMGKYEDLDVSGCIEGIIFPKSEEDAIYKEKDSVITEILDLLEKITSKTKILTY